MGICKLQWQREALEECCLLICKDFLSLLQSWQFLQQVNAIVRGVMHRQNVRHAMHRNWPAFSTTWRQKGLAGLLQYAQQLQV